MTRRGAWTRRAAAVFLCTAITAVAGCSAGAATSTGSAAPTSAAATGSHAHATATARPAASTSTAVAVAPAHRGHGAGRRRAAASGGRSGRRRQPGGFGLGRLGVRGDHLAGQVRRRVPVERDEHGRPGDQHQADRRPGAVRAAPADRLQRRDSGVHLRSGRYQGHRRRVRQPRTAVLTRIEWADRLDRRAGRDQPVRRAAAQPFHLSPARWPAGLNPGDPSDLGQGGHPGPAGAAVDVRRPGRPLGAGGRRPAGQRGQPGHPDRAVQDRLSQPQVWADHAERPGDRPGPGDGLLRQGTRRQRGQRGLGRPGSSPAWRPSPIISTAPACCWTSRRDRPGSCWPPRAPGSARPGVDRA